MTEFLLQCECGDALSVLAGDADSKKECHCDRTLEVPSLSVLRNNHQVDEADTKKIAFAGPFFIVILIVVFLFSLQKGSAALLLLGIVMFFGGRLWLVIQMIRELDNQALVLAYFVPFVPTLFFVKRRDITWKPFLLGTLGIFICIFSFVYGR